MAKPLLITHDGKEVFDCEVVWVIRSIDREPEQLKILNNVFDLYKDKGYLFFADRENAFRFFHRSKHPASMLEFKNPIPVIVEGSKDGYALYVRDGSTWENDIWAVVHCDGGVVRHYRSDQIRIHHNATFGISKQKTN